MKVNFKQYAIYLFRWQASTPILALVLLWLSNVNQWIATIVANLIGGLIFFWIDKFIFTSASLAASWEVKENITCVDCRKKSRGYRLVQATNYNRIRDEAPQFRCENCSKKKSKMLRKMGISH